MLKYFQGNIKKFEINFIELLTRSSFKFSLVTENLSFHYLNGIYCEEDLPLKLVFQKGFKQLIYKEWET